MTVPRTTPRPLYVDLDRTLVTADISLESFLRFMRRGLVETLLLALWLVRGRAVAKTMVARRVAVDPATLPYRAEVLARIDAARAEGRRVVLASASHHRQVGRIARHLGVFDAAIGSRGRHNLKGRAKLAWIAADAGGPFDYLGDSRADRAIWDAAEGPLSVGHVPRGGRVIAVPCPRVPVWRALAKAMRPHQWAKNVLIGVPLAASGQWSDPRLILHVATAFVLFSLAASGVYLVNDLLDIDADRAHRTKHRRPLASGALPIPVAVIAAAALLVGAPLAALATLGGGFAFVLIGYLVLTTAYSVRLKAAMTLDVIVLACLYTARIFAGAVAVAVPVSSWLLTFSVFLFLSLAYLKRYTELATTTATPDRLLGGRGYVGGDVEVVMMTGIAAAMTSILVLALFISNATPMYAHGTPALLWGLCLILLYWLNRVWMMARRGQVSGDPIAFAITDRRSIAMGGLAVLLVIAAQRIKLPI
jgi:4-hydroxybenzoate polyprenyltransferase